MIFADRIVAGKQLAEMLHLQLQNLDLLDSSQLLVVGLPRGGVPVALQVARRLNCPLDIIVSKKISLPEQQEYAIGAVSSDGVVITNAALVQKQHLENYIQQESGRLLKQTQEIETEFHRLGGCSPLSFAGKTIIIIDDGIATGMTAVAAADSAKSRGAATTIIAAPVMSIESYHDLERHCDHVMAISLPSEFLAVGLHYANFIQTTNDEVINALRQASQFVHSGEQSEHLVNFNDLLTK